MHTIPPVDTNISPPLSQDTTATDKGRQGVISGRIVTILGVSMALAIAALVIVYALS